MRALRTLTASATVGGALVLGGLPSSALAQDKQPAAQIASTAAQDGKAAADSGQSGTERELSSASPAGPAAQPAPQPAVAPPQPSDPPPNATDGQAVADPVLTIVRSRLEQPARSDARNDRAAVAKFYAARAKPIWVSSSGGLTAAGTKVIAEIRQADDWGLSATAFELPRIAAGEAAPEKLADAEIELSLAVAKYAYHARGGRIPDPSRLTKHFDQKPAPYETSDLLSQIADSDQPDAYLRKLHPQHPQFQRLRQALVKARGAPAKAAAEELAHPRLPEGKDLKPGERHASVALLRERLAIAAVDGDVDHYDQSLAAAVRAFQKEQGLPSNGVVGRATRTALNGPSGDSAKSSKTSVVQRLIVNMERWRWLPDDMGEFYVWDNIPEYQMRVQKAGKTIHQEKIIVGKVETQTPLFSADMKYVIFHPDWGVPDSIKLKEILPYLRRSSGFFGSETDTRVLQRHNLRVSHNGRPVDASQIDWSTVDIRRYQFIQPPSSTNVLGVVKFRFPNKHDVYMHDTPQRDLFAKSVRTFSHGCVRVQNPRRLAEVLLAEDKGWGPERIGQLLAGSQHDVTLTKRVPVHLTYFTTVVDDEGKLHTYADIYGHDSRVASALEGKPVELIAASDPAVAAERSARRQQVAKRASPEQPYNSMANFFSGLMGN